MTATMLSILKPGFVSGKLESQESCNDLTNRHQKKKKRLQKPHENCAYVRG